MSAEVPPLAISLYDQTQAQVKDALDEIVETYRDTVPEFGEVQSICALSDGLMKNLSLAQVAALLCFAVQQLAADE